MDILHWDDTKKQCGVYGVWSAHADTGPYVSGSFRRVCGLGGRRRRELSVTPPSRSSHRHRPLPTPRTRHTPPRRARRPRQRVPSEPRHVHACTSKKERKKKNEREKKPAAAAMMVGCHNERAGPPATTALHWMGRRRRRSSLGSIKKIR